MPGLLTNHHVLANIMPKQMFCARIHVHHIPFPTFQNANSIESCTSEDSDAEESEACHNIPECNLQSFDANINSCNINSSCNAGTDLESSNSHECFNQDLQTESNPVTHQAAIPGDKQDPPYTSRQSSGSVSSSEYGGDGSISSTDTFGVRSKERSVASSGQVYFAMDEEHDEGPVSIPSGSPPSPGSESSEPSDPRSPSSSDHSSESSNDTSDDTSDDGDDAFSLNPPRMFDVLQFHDDCTKKEAMSLILSHAMRHILDYIGVINLFSSMKTMLGRRYFPCTKRKLWRDLNKKSAGLVKRALCGNYGAQKSKDGTDSIHLLFVRIDELHPRLRQSFVLLAAVHIGVHEPNCQMFYKWFVKDANYLSTHGLVWEPDGVLEVKSKFVPTLCIVDAKERCRILNQSQFNGHHSCPFCTHFGVSIPDGPCRFPLPGTEVLTGREGGLFMVPECEPRSEESMRRQLLEANATGEVVQGMKPGLAPVFHLQGFKLCDSCSPDDLYPIYLGVAKFHTSLLISHFNLNEARQLIVTNRMKAVRLPRNISRQKMELSQRAKWKGSQWRTWLLYLAVPCLQNLQGFENIYVAHLELLSHSIYLLSRDITTEEDLETADRYLRGYVELFQHYYGPENMRFNVHMLLHMPEAVARWGNLWSQSRGEERILTEGERRILLDRHGLEIQEVTEFKELSMPHRMTCHPFDGNDDFKCDNSTVYTYSDMFGTIKSFVSYTVRGRDEVGMFVDILDTGDCVGSAHHIIHQDDGESVPSFINVSFVRSVAIKVPVGINVYLTPLANHMEID
ncbi:hypothetical protein ONE63_003494 [Megalurothrips usitatus]|uniref:Uncharacterized protein n=1 Tax=Megalurothrips usitatus TaxID=439358 RepID=A0AAV7X367_9NEOP|nr:hypothetical protein ONE63_003494 [Megalurothrips usitatus]